jgi:hypothetical protein
MATKKKPRVAGAQLSPETQARVEKARAKLTKGSAAGMTVTASDTLRVIIEHGLRALGV